MTDWQDWLVWAMTSAAAFYVVARLAWRIRQIGVGRWEGCSLCGRPGKLLLQISRRVPEKSTQAKPSWGNDLP